MYGGGGFESVLSWVLHQLQAAEACEFQQKRQMILEKAHFEAQLACRQYEWHMSIKVTIAARQSVCPPPRPTSEAVFADWLSVMSVTLKCAVCCLRVCSVSDTSHDSHEPCHPPTSKHHRSVVRSRQTGKNQPSTQTQMPALLYSITAQSRVCFIVMAWNNYYCVQKFPSELVKIYLI